MTAPLSIEGTWPQTVAVSRGWARCLARPWNQEVGAGHLRIVRGGASFLDEASTLVAELAGEDVYSPALYPSSTRLWMRVGYERAHRLIVMERATAIVGPPPRGRIDARSSRDLAGLIEVDESAFSGFWRMSQEGLREAVAATPRSVVLTAVRDKLLVGYAVVGAERATSFLQRVAVRPEYRRQGVGTDLVRAAIDWSRRQGTFTLILNVREQSTAALSVYRSARFRDTGTRLEVLRRRLPGAA